MLLLTDTNNKQSNIVEPKRYHKRKWKCIAITQGHYSFITKTRLILKETHLRIRGHASHTFSRLVLPIHPKSAD